MENNILFLCTAFQNTKQKVDHCITNLKKLKGYGADICFCTHSRMGLDQISEYCDYIFYDKDNSFPVMEDLFSVLGNIDDRKLSSSLYGWYGTFAGKVICTWMENHSKCALSNFKNGLNVAKDRGYKWIVYFEYDTIISNNNLVDFFKNRVEYLEKNNLSGHYYKCPDHRGDIPWPLFFTCKTDDVYNHPDMVADWQKSNRDYFLNFGTTWLEDSVLRIFNDVGNYISSPGLAVNEDFGYNIQNSLDVMISNDLVDQPSNYTYTKNPFNLCRCDLIPQKLSDDRYNLRLFIYVIEGISDCRLTNNVFINGNNLGGDIIFDPQNQSYYYMLDIIQDYTYNPEDETVITLVTTFRIGELDFRREVNLQLKDIKKLHLVQRME